MDHLAPDRFAPRALLIRPLEAEAVAAADLALDDYADFVFRRCAELREAGR